MKVSLLAFYVASNTLKPIKTLVIVLPGIERENPDPFKSEVFDTLYLYTRESREPIELNGGGIGLSIVSISRAIATAKVILPIAYYVYVDTYVMICGAYVRTIYSVLFSISYSYTRVYIYVCVTYTRDICMMRVYNTLSAHARTAYK